jgi:hypothetical protein
MGATPFYMQDSTAGTPAVSLTTGTQTVTQTETVIGPAAPPPPPPSVQVTSATFTPLQGRLHVALKVAGPNGEPVAARVSFAVLRNSSTFLSTLSQTAADGTVAVTGFPRLQLGCYRTQIRSVAATGYVWDHSSPTQTYCVTTLPARVGAVSYGRKNRHLHVGVRIIDDSGHSVIARVAFVVMKGKVRYASAAGRTKSSGYFALTAGKKLTKGCYVTKVTSVKAPHFKWDGVTGSNRYCVK